ncbi:hypothetical protein ACRRTK_019235 [Alexandromys fortis]
MPSAKIVLVSFWTVSALFNTPRRKASTVANICRPGYSSLSSHKYIPRRAVLYVPGNDEKKIKKIPSLKVDCAVLDCEDGVAENKKTCASMYS